MTTQADQPPPVPRPGVRSVQAAVADDVRLREQLGISRYNTTLQPFNGRDAWLDAYEEALDLAMYLRQALIERDGGNVAEAEMTARPALMAAPFEALVRIDTFGKNWSWRCQVPAGGSDACRWDRHVGDEPAAIRDSLAHLAAGHGIYATGTAS